VLVNGHFDGKLKGLCCHPSENKFYTIGEDKLLASWDIKTHSRIDGKLIEKAS